MEMKANVASAIKEMMAQMNSTSESAPMQKKDVEVRDANNVNKENLQKKDDNEVKKDTVVGDFKPKTDFGSAQEVGSSFQNAFGNAIKKGSEDNENNDEINLKDDDILSVPEKKEEPEIKKTFGTIVPKPYGSSAAKPPVISSSTETEKTPEDVSYPVSEPVIHKPQEVAPSEEKISDEKYGKTVIASGTVINGDIVSQGSLELSGEVLGNLKVDGELKIWGRVEGDIEANSLNVLGGKVKGNILSVGHVSLDLDTIVAGNINASSLLLDGKLKGDVDIEGSVTIGSTGVQIGKIIAKQLSIGQGAKLNSTIQMTNEDASAIAEEIFA